MLYEVNNREEYIIPFKRLALGRHGFKWKIEESFFSEYEMSEISDADIHVNVILIKHTDFLEFDFNFNGWAQVDCDRCLDPVRLDVVSDFKLYVKFAEVPDDETGDDDIVMLPHSEVQMDIAHYIYEYIHLSLPVRRVHPDSRDGSSTCNEAMIDRLKQYLI
jgi:uncharacterized metal-binding protein YceD (DUF177 family)